MNNIEKNYGKSFPADSMFSLRYKQIFPQMFADETNNILRESAYFSA